MVPELSREQPKTIKELRDITTRHASSEEAVGAAFVLGNVGAATNGGQFMPTKAIIKSTRKGTKGSKKGQKCWPRRVAIVANNGNGDEGADNSGDEFVAAAERDFKRQTQSPKDHLKKLLEATCQYHPYNIKHKLKDSSMIKKSWR
jgi:hypothetical protein